VLLPWSCERTPYRTRRDPVAGASARPPSDSDRAAPPLPRRAQGNKNGLPEVAILGHSNCGKSALLNALIGMRSRTGLADVDTRAGWTMRLHFYWVRPSGLLDRAVNGSDRGAVVVDTPGYGHAVGGTTELRHWRTLIDTYIGGSGSLQLALLLIDSTRGLCDADRRVLRMLYKRGVPTIAAITKCDLLTPDELACSHKVVAAQIHESLNRGGSAAKVVPPVPLMMLSSHFYGGVERLWDEFAKRLRSAAPQLGPGKGKRRDVQGGEGEVEMVVAGGGAKKGPWARKIPKRAAVAAVR